MHVAEWCSLWAGWGRGKVSRSEGGGLQPIQYEAAIIGLKSGKSEDGGLWEDENPGDSRWTHVDRLFPICKCSLFGPLSPESAAAPAGSNWQKHVELTVLGKYQ